MTCHLNSNFPYHISYIITVIIFHSQHSRISKWWLDFFLSHLDIIKICCASKDGIIWLLWLWCENHNNLGVSISWWVDVDCWLFNLICYRYCKHIILSYLLLADALWQTVYFQPLARAPFRIQTKFHFNNLPHGRAPPF